MWPETIFQFHLESPRQWVKKTPKSGKLSAIPQQPAIVVENGLQVCIGAPLRHSGRGWPISFALVFYRDLIKYVHKKILYHISVLHILSEAPAISIYIWFVEVSEARRHVLHMTHSSFHWQVFTWLWHHADFLYMGESNTDLQHLLSRCAIHLDFWDESCNT